MGGGLRLIFFTLHILPTNQGGISLSWMLSSDRPLVSAYFQLLPASQQFHWYYLRKPRAHFLFHPLMSSMVGVPSTSTVAGHCPTCMSTSFVSRWLLSPSHAKLVHRIQCGQFMEMWDLLGDKVTLNQHFEGVSSYFPTHVLPASSRPCLREVISLPSWIYMYCFLTYLAVGTSDHSI